MSFFPTHAGECFVCFMITILMSPHPYPREMDEAGKKSPLTNQEKKCGVLAAGKMLKKYFQRWTSTKCQVTGKRQVALESNL